MGMGYAGAHVTTIDEKVIKSKCPKQLAAFKKLAEEYGQYYTYMAIDGQGDMLTDEQCDKVIEAHELLTDAFEQKTGLEISYFYHDPQDGDRYDDIEEGWEVHNAFELTKAAKPYEKHIQIQNFVMFG